MQGVAKKNPYFLCMWNGLVGAGEISLISSEHNLLWGIYLCSKNYTCTLNYWSSLQALKHVENHPIEILLLANAIFGKSIWPSHADVGAKFSPGRNQKPEFQPVFIRNHLYQKPFLSETRISTHFYNSLGSNSGVRAMWRLMGQSKFQNIFWTQTKTLHTREMQTEKPSLITWLKAYGCVWYNLVGQRASQEIIGKILATAENFSTKVLWLTWRVEQLGRKMLISIRWQYLDQQLAIPHDVKDFKQHARLKTFYLLPEFTHSVLGGGVFPYLK